MLNYQIVLFIDVRPKKFFIYEYLDELSEAEKSQLSAAAKKACEGKPIRKTSKEEVTEEEFNKLKSGGGVVSGTSKRQISIPGCKTAKVCSVQTPKFIYKIDFQESCYYRPSSAWCYTPIYHSLSITKVL